MIRWVMIEYKIPTYLHSPLTHTVTHSHSHSLTQSLTHSFTHTHSLGMGHSFWLYAFGSLVSIVKARLAPSIHLRYTGMSCCLISLCLSVWRGMYRGTFHTGSIQGWLGIGITHFISCGPYVLKPRG
jgi:hypothetical protein